MVLLFARMQIPYSMSAVESVLWKRSGSRFVSYVPPNAIGSVLGIATEGSFKSARLSLQNE